MPLPPQPTNGDSFPLIAVVIGPKGFLGHNGPEWGAPYGLAHVAGDPSPDQRFTVWGNQFLLNEATDVQVASTWIPGKMATPIILTSPKP